MESRAKLFGHPIHQMLVVLPLGMLFGAVAFDLVRIVSGSGRYGEVAHVLIGAGLIAAVFAVPFGWIDWLAIPPYTRAKIVGRRHAIGNIAVLALFGVSWLMRRDAPASPSWPALSLSFAAGALAMVTAWLGGEMVSRLGVGVADGAHLNSPSSLSRRSAREGGPILSRDVGGSARHTPGRKERG
jgi:uncharacterized membrane protein